MKKLKPIVIHNARSEKYRNNVIQQNLLLKTMTYTSDMDEIKKVANFHSKTEVLRTLDKLAIRKDLHNALVAHGLDMNFLVEHLKDLCENAEKDETRLHSVQTVLKAVGMDKYETFESEGKDWEGLLMKISEQENKTGRSLVAAPIMDAEYEVITPEIPESARKVRDEDDAIGKSIYE